MTRSARSIGHRIEVLDSSIPRGRIRHAIFDFDGTLSLVREGWQDVMVPMMVEELSGHDPTESKQALELLVREYVTRLTGKQTIHQMFELVEQVRRRGGTPREPLEYKRTYLDRLDTRIRGRIEGLTSGAIESGSLLIPGSHAVLKGLRARNVRLYLASGTDETFVLREAKLLGIDEYFDGGIFGALDDHRRFSKKQVIDRILADHALAGPELLCVGDGYVEIENAKEVGAVALGVPSLEATPVDFDPWKKTRLIEAGADLLAPNFLEHQALLRYLFDE